jgi:hypothetical protein
MSLHAPIKGALSLAQYRVRLQVAPQMSLFRGRRTFGATAAGGKSVVQSVSLHAPVGVAAALAA